MINSNELAIAVKRLKEGKLVVFPTETVYALAGDARNLAAVQQIFALKERPTNQALSVLLAKEHSLDKWARDIPLVAKKLAQHFWPGPLTLILHKEKSVLKALTGGQDKIGLRVPDHPIAQAILNSFGSGLAAPSANRSSHLSPTQIEHVRQEFDNELEFIIDGGPCTIGIESTIIDVTFDIPRIVRIGAISLDQIEQITSSECINTIQSIRSTTTFLQQIPMEKLDKVVNFYLSQDKKLMVFGFRPAQLNSKNLTWVVMPINPFQYGQVLYKYLREANQHPKRKILVETLPKLDEWAGIQRILDKKFA